MKPKGKERLGDWWQDDIKIYTAISVVFSVLLIALWILAAFLCSLWIFGLSLVASLVFLIYFRLIRDEMEEYYAKKILNMRRMGKKPLRTRPYLCFINRYGIRKGTAIYLMLLFFAFLPVVWIMATYWNANFAFWVFMDAVVSISVYFSNVRIQEKVKRMEEREE